MLELFAVNCEVAGMKVSKSEAVAQSGRLPLLGWEQVSASSKGILFPSEVKVEH